MEKKETNYRDVSCPKCGAIPQYGHFCNDMGMKEPHKTVEDSLQEQLIAEGIFTVDEYDTVHVYGDIPVTIVHFVENQIHTAQEQILVNIHTFIKENIESDGSTGTKVNAHKLVTFIQNLRNTKL